MGWSLLLAVVSALVAVSVAWFPPAVLVVLLLVALVVAWPTTRHIVMGASWSVPLLLSLLLILVDVRASSASDGPLRYAGTMAVLVCCAALKYRGGPANGYRPVRLVASVLFVYGMVGVLIGRLFLDTAQGSLPIVLPLAIVIVGATVGPVEERATRLACAVITLAAAAFALMCVVSRIDGKLVPLAVFNHEKAFLVILGVSCAFAVRSRILTVISSAAALGIFLTYPAATYALAALVAAATYAASFLRWSRVARIAVAAGVGASLLVATLNVDRLIALTSVYFRAVGKTDNGSTRLDLYRLALNRIFEAPLFSTFFTGEVTVVTTLSGDPNTVLPVHNDYLSIALGGGIVATALLVALVLVANGLAFRALRVSTGRSIITSAVIALQGGLNAAAAVAFANPVFMNPGSSTVVYALLLALVSLSASILEASVSAGAQVVPASGGGLADVPSSEEFPTQARQPC